MKADEAMKEMFTARSKRLDPRNMDCIRGTYEHGFQDCLRHVMEEAERRAKKHAELGIAPRDVEHDFLLSLLDVREICGEGES